MVNVSHFVLLLQDVTVGSFHIFKPFSVPREEAAIFWKVSSKNLIPITQLQHLRGVKTNPIKFSLGLAGRTRLSAASQQRCIWPVRLHRITCCQPLVWVCFQPQPPLSEPSSRGACRAQELMDFVSSAWPPTSPRKCERSYNGTCKWRILESHEEATFCDSQNHNGNSEEFHKSEWATAATLTFSNFPEERLLSATKKTSSS